jgi:hypothetical protein
MTGFWIEAPTIHGITMEKTIGGHVKIKKSSWFKNPHYIKKRNPKHLRMLEA